MAWTLAQIHARHATTYGAHAQAASHTTGLTEAVVEARECAVFSERLRARIRSKYQVQRCHAAPFVLRCTGLPSDARSDLLLLLLLCCSIAHPCVCLVRPGNRPP